MPFTQDKVFGRFATVPPLRGQQSRLRVYSYQAQVHQCPLQCRQQHWRRILYANRHIRHHAIHRGWLSNQSDHRCSPWLPCHAVGSKFPYCRVSYATLPPLFLSYDACLLILSVFRDLMIKRDIISRHFEVYMYCLYWMPSLGFLHPPTIWRQIQVRRQSQMVSWLWPVALPMLTFYRI